MTCAMRWRGQRKQGTPVAGFGSSHSGRRWVTDFVARHLQSVVQDRVLLDRIPRVKDLQSAWLLLLRASARANYMLRSVDPNRTGEFAQAHDEGIWNCVCDILQIEAAQFDTVRSIASPHWCWADWAFAERVRSSACWASWADCIPTIDARLSHVARLRAAQEAAWIWKASWGAAHHHGSPSGTVPDQTGPTTPR